MFFGARPVLFSVLLFAAVAVHAHRTMREIWVTMPDSVVPYLNHELRVELADYWDMSAEAKVKNLLENETRIVKMSGDYMEVKLNSSTDAQLRTLAVDDSTYIICMVKTFNAPAKESVVAFFTEDWKPVGGTFGLPSAANNDEIKDMFTAPADTMTVKRYDELCCMIEPVMLVAVLSETEDVITFNLSLPFLTKDEKKDVASVLRQRKFKWDGKMFKEC